MGIIFDSCIWIELASNQGLDRQSILDAAGDEIVFASVISIGELGFGVHSCADPSERAIRSAYLCQLESQPILDVSKHTAAAFGVLAAAIKQSGRSPRPRLNDLWIAAQAIEHGYALLTLNTDGFTGLPGLQLVSPSSNSMS